MNTSPWQNTEDIRRDLFEYSDIDYMEDTFAPAPPKSISEYKARTSKVKNPGLFDDIDNVDVGVFISGRGKYLVDRIITPGRPVESVPEDDFNIKKRIREVSGLGYSNEIIEKAFVDKHSGSDDENLYQDLMTTNLKLSSTGSISSPSGASSPRLSPLHEKSDMLDFENMSTEDSLLSECIKPEVITVHHKKKKKKFTKWSSKDPSVNVNSVLNVNAAVWVPSQNNGTRINSSAFPLLK